MKTTSSLVLALLAIYSFIQAAQALTPISVNYIGNSGQTSVVVAEFVHDTTIPSTGNIDFKLVFPGQFSSVDYPTAYHDVKCDTVVKITDADNPNVPNQIRVVHASGISAPVQTSDNNTTVTGVFKLDLEQQNPTAKDETPNGESAVVDNSVDTIASADMIASSIPLLEHFKIICQYTSPVPAFSQKKIEITANLNHGKDSTVAGFGENRARKSIITGLGVYLNNRSSIMEPTSFSFRGVNSSAEGKTIKFRNAPASHALTGSRIKFSVTGRLTPCEIFQDGVRQLGNSYASKSSDGIEILLAEKLNTGKNYDIYCSGVHAVKESQDYPDIIAKSLPAMIEFSYEDGSYFYQTVDTASTQTPLYIHENKNTTNTTNEIVVDRSETDQDDTLDLTDYPQISYYHIHNYRKLPPRYLTFEEIQSERRNAVKHQRMMEGLDPEEEEDEEPKNPNAWDDDDEDDEDEDNEDNEDKNKDEDKIKDEGKTEIEDITKDDAEIKAKEEL